MPTACASAACQPRSTSATSCSCASGMTCWPPLRRCYCLLTPPPPRWMHPSHGSPIGWEYSLHCSTRRTSGARTTTGRSCSRTRSWYGSSATRPEPLSPGWTWCTEQRWCVADLLPRCCVVNRSSVQIVLTHCQPKGPFDVVLRGWATDSGAPPQGQDEVNCGPTPQPEWKPALPLPFWVSTFLISISALSLSLSLSVCSGVGDISFPLSLISLPCWGGGGGGRFAYPDPLFLSQRGLEPPSEEGLLQLLRGGGGPASGSREGQKRPGGVLGLLSCAFFTHVACIARLLPMARLRRSRMLPRNRRVPLCLRCAMAALGSSLSLSLSLSILNYLFPPWLLGSAIH